MIAVGGMLLFVLVYGYFIVRQEKRQQHAGK